ncbi:FirrV-1-F3 [Feldmannia irregularis virus a]|uniref:FirrV-1-F3 n=1 Tax=Feldmannia irregularis virus a TaxID=231992 RepID=Q6XLV4_9PHYC|nr:FirrV-1-F3 [Feldmannia irregularis virus a]AAR26957.1 FirrV-1-F3 [Feldmannia irregularis virus a]
MVNASTEDWEEYLYIPLWRTIRLEDVQLFVRMLDAGANFVGNGILHDAVRGGLEEFCQLLLARGADVDEHDKYGANDTPLMAAVPFAFGVSMAELLLAAGANVDERNFNDMSALDLAVYEGNVSFVQLIAGRVRDINEYDREGKTVLHYTTSVEIVNELVSAGSDVNGGRDGTPLHYASEGGQVDVMVALLGFGASPNITDERGDTALHVLCYTRAAGFRHAVHKLLEFGADISSLNKNGDTPAQLLNGSTIDMTASSDEVGRVRLLLRAGM